MSQPQKKKKTPVEVQPAPSPAQETHSVAHATAKPESGEASSSQPPPTAAPPPPTEAEQQGPATAKRVTFAGPSKEEEQLAQEKARAAAYAKAASAAKSFRHSIPQVPATYAVGRGDVPYYVGLYEQHMCSVSSREADDFCAEIVRYAYEFQTAAAKEAQNNAPTAAAPVSQPPPSTPGTHCSAQRIDGEAPAWAFLLSR